MKLLLDENLSPKLIASLNDLYPGSQHVDRCGLDASPDSNVWAFARDHEYAIVTKDADFIS